MSGEVSRRDRDLAKAVEALLHAARGVAGMDAVIGPDRTGFGIVFTELGRIRDRHLAAPMACPLPDPRPDPGRTLVKAQEKAMLAGNKGEAA